MAKTKRKSAGTAVTGASGSQKRRSKRSGGGSPKKKVNNNLPIKRKRPSSSKKLKTNVQLAMRNLDVTENAFRTNRRFSVTKVRSGKNIQVTCRNDSTPTTSRTSNNTVTDPLNGSDEDDANLSLASYGKKLIKKKLSFARKFKNEQTASTNRNCDTTDKNTEYLPLKVVKSDNITPADDTLIIIDDDDDTNDAIELNATSDVEVVDLTTPQPTPAKTELVADRVQVWAAQNPIVDLTTPHTEKNHLLNPQIWDVSQNSAPQTQLFPPIPMLAQPMQHPVLHTASELFGSNFLNAGSVRTVGLRPIFIDGNNVALGHSNGKFFSVKGLRICIDYFKIRGHEVTAIVPQIRKRRNQNSDTELLKQLESDGSVVFTPSRYINGRHIVPYDDRFIVQLAAVHLGVIVSCDNYRDLLAENPNLRDTIENRVLNPTFVKDMIIFPSDPLGRWGPKLDEFLRFP